MYELSQTRRDHKRDLRCLDYHAGRLVTGGSDNVLNIFSLADGKL